MRGHAASAPEGSWTVQWKVSGDANCSATKPSCSSSSLLCGSAGQEAVEALLCRQPVGCCLRCCWPFAHALDADVYVCGTAATPCKGTVTVWTCRTCACHRILRRATSARIRSHSG